MPREDQFIFTLQHARNGDLQRELSAALSDCKDAARDSGKAATLTLTLSISAKGRQFLIIDKVAKKLPAGDQDVTVMFEDDAGNFTRKDPRQPELPLRDANAAPTDLKEVSL